MREGIRLFCFPYAGGNPYLFRAWPPLLDYPVELLAVQSPGKGSRIMERPCETVAQLVEGLLQAMLPMLHERPFSFFGHSNGALIAFELACQLQRRGLPLPSHLFLSASPAPWTRTYERSYANMSEEEFKAVLRDMEGTPEEILADVGLFRLVLPGLRADFSLGETYRFNHDRPLRVPATLFHGEHDDIAETQVLAWRDQLSQDAPLIRLPGGHFFLHSHLRELATHVGAQLRMTHGPQARVLRG
jgi:medium-chain acyl-[acyl-carrier-protein] hydrolase